MKFKKAHIIFNPESSGGRTGESRQKILDLVEKYFGNDFNLYITNKKNDASLFAHRSVEEGCDLIISIGGDGTIQEIVNGILSCLPNKINTCSIGIISSGTGQGFAQSLDLPKTWEDQIKLISQGNSKKIDVGKVTFNNCNHAISRYFINEFQIGIGGAVVNCVNHKQKRAGGFLAFGLGTVSTVFKYPNQRICFLIDGKKLISDDFTGIVVANGKYTGGGMKLAPLSNLNDGFLDLLLIYNQTPYQRIFNFPKIYSGNHIKSKNFSYGKIKNIQIDSNESIPIEADGEIWGSLPCEVDIIPSALNVITKN